MKAIVVIYLLIIGFFSLLFVYNSWFRNKKKKDDEKEAYRKRVGEKHKLILGGWSSIPVGDGWIPLVDTLCTRLQKLTEWDPEKHPQIKVTQIKEKFGGLRFYVGAASTEQHEAISFAEQLSYSICENCSSMKDIGYTEGWVTTVCEHCIKNDKAYKGKKWNRAKS